jgi:hypothetical protein
MSPDLTRENPGVPASVGRLVPKGADKLRGVIYALAPSFKTVDTLWAGTDDGQVWITRDGGKNWSDITPKEVTAWSKVTQISASHFDEHTAYASVSRFRINDGHPYIYRTHDGGQTWKEITAGLPDFGPVDTVREDPVRKGLLFAGTENAVWVSFDDGDHWQSLQLNLPHTSMRDLWIHESDLIVATHGRSFWVLDDISPLRQNAEVKAAQTDPWLAKPGDSYRVRRSTYTDTPLPADEPAGENPPDGAVIDYALPEGVEGPVTLEIVDAAGKVVRRYASDDKPEQTREEMEKQLIPMYWLRMPSVLPATAGMHRWVWDLRYATPTATRYEYPISAVPRATPRTPQGPLALPGTYTVRLKANGKTLTAPLTVKMDPRVTASRAELENLFRVESQLAGLVNDSARAALEAHSAREQIEKLTKNASADTKESLESQGKALDALLKGKEKSSGGEAEPGLDDVAGEAAGLYAQVGQADAAPTAAQREGAEHVSAESKGVLGRWEKIKSTSLPALNHKLTAAGLPAIDLERQPEDMPEGGDED